MSKYEKELEDVRDQINDVKPSDPIAWLPNPKTIESESFHSFYITVLLISFLVKLLNGTCTVTAAEDLTIKDACRRSNRFNGIDYDKARLEYYVTDTNHENKKVSIQHLKWSKLIFRFSLTGMINPYYMPIVVYTFTLTMLNT